MARLRLPPGVTRDDALQEASALEARWYAEGRRESHLFVRVWGDLKDKYGFEWKKHFVGGAVERLPEGFDTTDKRYAVDPAVTMDVRAAVAKLSPAQRHVVEECALKGRAQADVAAERGVSVQNIKLLYMRARRKLTQLLAGYAEVL